MSLRSETLSEQIQRREGLMLSHLACRADQSKGRAREEEPCTIRTCFQRDTDRILYSKAFRRLKHKTQVFLDPKGDHYYTRMNHTLEVSRIARTISRALSLNEDLTEAIALGHDLGHTPFGYAGELALNELLPGGFNHYEQSIRVVERLENDGEGLNLTWEVLDGILSSSDGKKAATLEGQVVCLADQIAYINHDIEDALRAQVIYPMDIPLDASKVLGFTQRERINTMVNDAVQSSWGRDEICRSDEVEEASELLKDFVHESIHASSLARSEERKAGALIRQMFHYYQENPAELPQDFLTVAAEDGQDRAICDYIAGMTDPYAVAQFQELFIPEGWTLK